MFAATGLEPQVTRREPLAATPATKKKSRRKRDAELVCPELTAPSEDQEFHRTENDDVVSGSTRPSRHHHHHHTRMSGASASRSDHSGTEAQQQRSRSNSRGAGSANSNISGSTSGSVHRRLSSTSKRETAACVPEMVVNASLARQSLTSSASALRPSKQWLEQSRLLSRAHIECRAQLDRCNNSGSNNNHEDNDDDDASSNNSTDISASNQPETHSRMKLGAEDWMYEKTSTTTTQRVPAIAAALPSRARRYRNTTPQPNFSSLHDGIEDNTGDGESAHSVRREQKSSDRASAHASTSKGASTLLDRPPSRQRHAFPTHLIDINGFLAQSANSSSASTSSKTSSRDKSVRSATASIPIPDATNTERPPSRYMAKVNRSQTNGAPMYAGPASDHGSPISAQDSPGSASDCTNSSRVPSRRCVDGVYSLNQVNHDPKTDGFADVDESVPPPFRIEITTDSHYSTAARVSPPTSSMAKRLDYSRHDRSSLQSRRWSSFGNQEQLQQHILATQNGDDLSFNSFSGMAGGSASQVPTGRKKPIEWFGQDDQINNAHLFETIVSLPSPRFDHDFDTVDDRSPISSTSAASSLEKMDYASPPPRCELPVRSTARGPSVLAVLPSSRLQQQGKKQISDQQWILASNNPFFYNAPDHPTTADFDDMDPETAIEQTPLYCSEDLMTIATEMSDLHLDDFIMGELQPMPLSIALGAGTSGGAAIGATPAPSALHTSLGKDFLSLFAQH